MAAAVAATNRTSAYTTRTTGTDSGRPTSQDETKKEIWSSMLDGVSSSKRLPEKSLLVLGGTPETQRDFLESLSTDSKRRPVGDSSSKTKPPIANQFALGYTYQDVLDADQEDILARLSLYLLTDPSPSFTPLLKPLLNTRTLPHMLIVILLDWRDPWAWMRQLREWIRVLRTLLFSLDVESKDVMEENIASLKERGRSAATAAPIDGSSATAAAATTEPNVTIPHGPGEWDEPLGMPLCVVCQNADKIEQLEKESGWKEEEFDYILQYMRTVLLKHGASLIYTMPSAPGALATLIHSSLRIHSTLKPQALEHNVIDRDRILVPPNWDSWGKIRVLSEGFDLEGVSKSWSVDIQGPPEPAVAATSDGDGAVAVPDATAAQTDEQNATDDAGSAVGVYEDTIRDPSRASALRSGNANASPGAKNRSGSGARIEVESEDNQVFLASKLETLEKLRAEDEKERSSKESKKAAAAATTTTATNMSRGNSSAGGGGVVEEHIGPVQFNVGGIQLDADDMLRRLKDRETHRSIDQESSISPVTSPGSGAGAGGVAGTGAAAGTGTEGGKSENEMLASFFAGLMKRGGTTANAAPKS